MKRLISLLLIFAAGCCVYVGAARTMHRAAKARANAVQTILGAE